MRSDPAAANPYQAGGRVAGEAQPWVEALQERVLACGMLTEAYKYDPGKAEHNPTFTAAEEAFARTGHFATI